ncbi:MAG: hypothetical protein ACK4TA_25085, partial [Saprospiraceae bacterium]
MKPVITLFCISIYLLLTNFNVITAQELNHVPNALIVAYEPLEKTTATPQGAAILKEHASFLTALQQTTTGIRI